MAFQIPTCSLCFPLKNPFVTFYTGHFTHRTFCWCRSQRILVSPDEQKDLQVDFHRLQYKDRNSSNYWETRSSLDIASCGVTSDDALYALMKMMMMMMMMMIMMTMMKIKLIPMLSVVSKEKISLHREVGKGKRRHEKDVKTLFEDTNNTKQRSLC